MNGDEILVRRIVSEIHAELSNILRLRDEYNEFINKYKSVDKYLLRVKASYLGVRPPVISSNLYNSLRLFLGFRHVVRQAYGFQLDESKLEELVSSFEDTVRNFSSETIKFCDILLMMSKDPRDNQSG